MCKIIIKEKSHEKIFICTSVVYCTFVGYADLCGRGVGSKLRYFWDADDKEKEKMAVLAGAAATAVGVAGKVIKTIINK